MAANQQRPVVNQRLYFAHLHLQWLERELASEDLPAATVEQALGESLFFHLQAAYRSYLLEIAESYGLFPQSLDSARDFQLLLEREGKTAAQVTELVGLETSDSWLAYLLSNATDAVLPVNKVPSGSNIALVELATGETTVERAKHCCEQLSALIENQRVQLEEW